ncbi:DUF3019 domain-containing protein [Cellvibrio mixtus]|uniref:DUF3019 domain-containing protein n=1 Tax=Cellvibrio mixtus TaxID=39650 RepID=UPI00069467B3|nr:DUF3019 domain-containing protein [Cellvibrio mixtus]
MSRLIQGIRIALLLPIATSVFAADEAATSAVPEPASLLLTPSRCVALHQGQVCYQRVQISWSSFAAGNYCVYQEATPQPLHCWQEQTQGTFVYEFASDSSLLLQLKNAQQQVVAESTMEVAWVYKANTRRKTHWRLF